MKSMISKTILSASIAVAVSGAHAGTQIDVEGVKPGNSIDTLNVKGANQGTNILSVDTTAGSRIFNIDQAGAMFVTLGNTEKATRLVLQNQQTGALETSGKLENQDTNVLGDANKMDFLVRETDANGVPTGGFGEISEEGMGNFVESLITTNTSGGGIDWKTGSNLGNKLDGNTSTEDATLYMPVQDGSGTKGYVSEADLVDLIEKYSGSQGGSGNGSVYNLGELQVRNTNPISYRTINGQSLSVTHASGQLYFGASLFWAQCNITGTWTSCATGSDGLTGAESNFETILTSGGDLYQIHAVNMGANGGSGSNMISTGQYFPK